MVLFIHTVCQSDVLGCYVTEMRRALTGGLHEERESEMRVMGRTKKRSSGQKRRVSRQKEFRETDIEIQLFIHA